MPASYDGGWTPAQTIGAWGGGGGGFAGGGGYGGNFGYGAGPTGAPGGSLSPASARGYNPAYGGVPYMPDPITSAGRSIGGNIGNLGNLYRLAGGAAGASAHGAATQVGANLPGYSGLTAAASRNIASDLAGNISPDVVNMLSTQAAERGVGFGAGAPNSNAALLRALGLTSMGLQAQGGRELTEAVGRTPTGPAFNPNAFLASPGDVQGAQLGANIYGSAPVPAAAAGAAVGAVGAGFGAGRGGGPSAGGFGVGGGYGGSSPASPVSWASDRLNAPAGGALGFPTGPQEASPAGVGRWNDWYGSLFGSGHSSGGGTSEASGLGLSPEDEQFYSTYGFLPGGFEGGAAPSGGSDVAPYDWSQGAGGATDYFSDTGP